MALIPYNMPCDFDFFSPFDNISLCSSMKNIMNTDIVEGENELKIVMDVPGIKKENLKITLEKGVLTVSGSTQSESEEKDQEGNYIKKERHSGEFTRSFNVNKNLDKSDVKAKLENGTLTLTLPKSQPEESNSNVIDIE